MRFIWNFVIGLIIFMVRLALFCFAVMLRVLLVVIELIHDFCGVDVSGSYISKKAHSDVQLPRLPRAEPQPQPKKSYDYYDDPVDRAFDHFENSPEDLDMEDAYWMDEMLG